MRHLSFLKYAQRGLVVLGMVVVGEEPTETFIGGASTEHGVDGAVEESVGDA